MATTIFLVNPQTFGGGGSSFTNEKSLLFDGVDEYMNVGRLTEMEASEASISFWIKFVNVANNKAFLNNNNGGTSQFRMYTSSSRIVCYAFGFNLISGTLSSGTWYNVIVTLDPLVGKEMYINGASVASTANITFPTHTSNYDFGRSGAGSYSNMYMDEVSVFDYALTSGQVTSIYNSGLPTDLDNTSGVTAPVHWWRMGDGDTYPTITDVGTTGGNDGTMVNMESGDIVTDTP